MVTATIQSKILKRNESLAFHATASFKFIFLKKNAFSSKKVYGVKEILTFSVVYWFHRGDSFGGTGIKILC